jgi:hypothetical protein
MPDAKTIVEYARPMPHRHPPSPLVAMVLCFPGMICWAIFLAAWLRLFPSGSASPLYDQPELRGKLLMLCWITAILTALISLWLYFKSPKPWYVIWNLFVNIAGLLMSAVGIGGIVLILMTFHGD